MILDGNLMVHPGIVIVAFLGMQIGCLLPIVTWPISKSLPIKDGQAFFFSYVSQFFRGFVLSVCLMLNRLHSIVMIFCSLSIIM